MRCIQVKRLNTNGKIVGLGVFCKTGEMMFTFEILYLIRIVLNYAGILRTYH